MSLLKTLETCHYQTPEENMMKDIILRVLQSRNPDIDSACAELVTLTRQAGKLLHIDEETLLDYFETFLKNVANSRSRSAFRDVELVELMIKNAQSRFSLAYAIWFYICYCRNNSLPKDNGVNKRQQQVFNGPGAMSLTSKR
ncbi:MAG: hypothetical protein XD95_0481 [Microgenomates bacterium 39_7]|nr:MAG: hypothetical protein XD95_0481 [Microgenomates bacterium 39_7]